MPTYWRKWYYRRLHEQLEMERKAKAEIAGGM